MCTAESGRGTKEQCPNAITMLVCSEGIAKVLVLKLEVYCSSTRVVSLFEIRDTDRDIIL